MHLAHMYLLACGGSTPVIPVDTDADADTDADVDSDVDSDVDADADPVMPTLTDGFGQEMLTVIGCSLCGPLSARDPDGTIGVRFASDGCAVFRSDCEAQGYGPLTPVDIGPTVVPVTMVVGTSLWEWTCNNGDGPREHEIGWTFESSGTIAGTYTPGGDSCPSGRFTGTIEGVVFEIDGDAVELGTFAFDDAKFAVGCSPD